MSDRLSRSEPQAQPIKVTAAEPVTSLPAASMPRALEREIRDMAPYQMRFVDSAGGLHREKSDILDKKIPPLVSFRKEHDDSFRVYAGLPPRNSTHCGTGAVPSVAEIDKLPNLHGPVILNSGDWIALTAVLPIKIPTFRQPDVTFGTPSEKLSHLIASANVGDTLVLGREVESSCPKVVSRAHISVKVLERIELSPTRIQLRIVAIPGMEGSHPIFEVKQDGSLEQIVGSKKISAGGTIQIGTNGERFTLPHPENSIEADSILYHHSILRGDRDANQSVMSVHGLDGLKKAQYFALKDFVLRGVDLIRVGQPIEAIKHLIGDSKELAAAGYRVEAKNGPPLDTLTPEAVTRSLDLAAQQSSFKAHERLISATIGERADTKTAPSNPQEEALLQQWHKNMALIVADQFVQALQAMNGGAISDYTPIRGGKHMVSAEADAALFFKRHGIDLSDGLFVNRHPDRELAVEEIEGIQTRQEALRFKATVLSAPLGAPVSVHDGVQVARTEGGYIVSLTDSNVQCFVLRSTGAACPLREPQTLQGADELFVGGKRFALPRFSSDALNIEKV